MLQNHGHYILNALLLITHACMDNKIPNLVCEFSKALAVISWIRFLDITPKDFENSNIKFGVLLSCMPEL